MTKVALYDRMKLGGHRVEEYEYILMALEEYLTHYNSMVICLENCGARSKGSAYDEFFNQFAELRKRYKELDEIDGIDECLERSRFRLIKENDFDEYIHNMKQLAKKSGNESDVESLIGGFYAKVNSQDVIKLETELAIYPYLLKQIRNQEEG